MLIGQPMVFKGTKDDYKSKETVRFFGKPLSFCAGIGQNSGW
jgi:hypothetical protein